MGRRSFSQLSTYSKCPERYRLQKIVKIPEPPSIWLPAGSAAGHACDIYDMLGDEHYAEDAFNEKLEELVSELEVEYGMGREKFEVNGKTKTTLPEGKTFDWWIENFPAMLRKYTTWRESSGYRLAQVGDLPAIELEVRLDLGNDTQVVGYLDRLFVRPDGRHEVVDLKAGTTQPGLYQLATYAYAVGIQYGLEVDYGSFFMLQKDGHTSPKWLPPYTAGSTVQQTYRRLDEAIKGGHFVPNISGDCFRCPMAAHCDFVGKVGGN